MIYLILTLNKIAASACRFKVVGWLKKKFVTPLEAEEHYFTATLPKSTSTSTQTEMSLEVLSTLFSQYCRDKLNLNVENDFLVYAAPAMNRLKAAGRTNVLHDLAKGIGISRNDGSDSLFPVKRMPMGLLQFIATFFVSSDSRNVSFV